MKQVRVQTFLLKNNFYFKRKIKEQNPRKVINGGVNKSILETFLSYNITTHFKILSYEYISMENVKM